MSYWDFSRTFLRDASQSLLKFLAEFFPGFIHEFLGISAEVIPGMSSRDFTVMLPESLRGFLSEFLQLSST